MMMTWIWMMTGIKKNQESRNKRQDAGIKQEMWTIKRQLLIFLILVLDS